MRELSAIMKSFGNWLKPVLSSSSCMGCGTSREKGGFIIPGPGVSLCRECVDDALKAMMKSRQEIVAVRGSNAKASRCSFCGHRGTDNGGLATWPDGAICGDCLLLCDEILAEG